MRTIITLLAFALTCYAGDIDTRTATGKQCIVEGRVFEKTKDGVVVDCIKSKTIGVPKAAGRVFVLGDFPEIMDGAIVKIYADHIGIYSYTNALKTSTIPALKVTRLKR